MWYEFNTGISDNLTEVMKIIDDALCFGFEFKVENHKLYFRELNSYPHYQQSYPHKNFFNKI